MALVKLTGRVIEKNVGGTSKSARRAIVLQAPQGDYILRRAGGNAFRDAELVKLVGKRLKVSGERDGRTLFKPRPKIA